MFDVGANYLNKFGDVTVALFGAFAYAPSCRATTVAAANANTVYRCQPDRVEAVGGRRQFGFAGFTVGGSVG